MSETFPYSSVLGRLLSMRKRCPTSENAQPVHNFDCCAHEHPLRSPDLNSDLTGQQRVGKFEMYCGFDSFEMIEERANQRRSQGK